MTLLLADPNPLDNPELYDVVFLAGSETPGVALVAGAGDPRKWDKQDGQGASGATLKFHGRDLSEFDIELRFWLSEHFRQWRDFKKILEASKVPDSPKSGKPSIEKALEIRHPLLDDVGIRAVIVRDFSQLTQVADGEWSVTIKLTAFRKPKPAGGVPQGAKTTDDITKNVQAPEDEYDRKIDRLVGQIDELAGGGDGGDFQKR